ncbi:protein FAM3D isoform X2 [Rhinatrema bivittatum]|uniref:protein FAM3D isoform X2 n=1 Tax=Rhinatrema bivittatum TaxID=194408 RepID=UPI00112E45F1|nr:protein FAM3D isoform X2 [Rhinatrema bivittatum]XP_029456852.1 protein FAM3D isoform X2 [Rhinatrema bivittatum]XP_029456853.1 protein FAM3D isoform X2 [Rhinatrema bivittatum]XP_029456854.1 protein FAM3D isoform X2 [Rhinatrema bivittatum]
MRLPDSKSIKNKCGIAKPCGEKDFAFRIMSGAASAVGPSICLDGKIIMSSVKNNIGKGINIAFINGTNGEVLKTGFFDMYAGDVNELLDFVKPVQTGIMAMVASYDEPASKLNDEARKYFTDTLGSNYANMLQFRDNWILIGVVGMKNKSPFEQHIKNDGKTNKYEGWPEMLEMEGCVPRKME